LTILNSDASPANTWYAGANSTNTGPDNSGWIFTAPPAGISVEPAQEVVTVTGQQAFHDPLERKYQTVSIYTFTPVVKTLYGVIFSTVGGGGVLVESGAIVPGLGGAYSELITGPESVTISTFVPTVGVAGPWEGTPSVESVTATGYTISLVEAFDITIPIEEVLVTGYEPVIAFEWLMGPAPEEILVTGYSPVIEAPQSITIPIQEVLITGYQITYSLSGGTLIPATEVIQVTGYTPTVVAEGSTLFSAPGYGCVAITFTGTNVVTADILDNTISIHSGASATITSTFASPGDFPRDLTYSGGNLISTDFQTDLIYFHTGVTDTIASSYLTGDAGYAIVNLCMQGSDLVEVSSRDYFSVHTGLTSTISAVWSNWALKATKDVYSIIYAPSATDWLICDTAGFPGVVRRYTDFIAMASAPMSSFDAEGLGYISMCVDGSENLMGVDYDSSIIYVHNGLAAW
jgi:hypothetical protein